MKLQSWWSVGFNRSAGSSIYLGSIGSLFIFAVLSESAYGESAPPVALPPVTVEAPTQRSRPAVRKSSVGKQKVQPPRQRVREALAPVNPSSNSNVGSSVGYAERLVSSTTKTAIPYLENPQSVSIINRRLLDERQPVTLTEALYNVAGVADRGGLRGYDNLTIRGFDVGPSNVFLDGLRVERGNQNVRQEISGLEKIEVLKGPGAVLFGPGPLGGIIAQTSKRPTLSPIGVIEATFGSFAYKQGRFDVGGAVGENVAARLNGVIRDNDTFVDFYKEQRAYVAPAITFGMNGPTKLTVLGTYTRDRRDGQYVGLPAVGTILPNGNGQLPRSRYIGEPGLDRVNLDRGQIGYLFEHSFSEAWQVRQNLRFSSSDVLSIATFAGALQPDQFTLNRQTATFNSDDRSLAVDTHIEGKFATGPVRHTLLFGVDAYDQHVKQQFAFSAIAPINIFVPVYGAQPVPGTTFFALNEKRDDRLIGTYVQDKIDVTDRLTFVLGGRFDTSDTRSLALATNIRREQYDDGFSGRAGAIYKLTPEVAVYGNYAQSFQPNFGVVVGGGPQRPERGELFEGGLKTDFANGRFVSTLVFYDLTRSNVLVANPAIPGFSLQTGEQRSRGLEIDAAFRMTPEFALTSAYAFTDVEITKDTTLPIGDRPISVPRHQASFWGTYDFISADKQRLTFGLGGRYVADREGTLPNTYKLPDYGTVDAALIYRYENMRAQLNVYNLFDKTYVASASPTGLRSVLIGEPLTIRASLSWVYF